MITTKKHSRIERWETLRSILRTQILRTTSQQRLETLLARLNIVNKDNRETNNKNGAGLPPFKPATIEQLIEWKSKNTVKQI